MDMAAKRQAAMTKRVYAMALAGSNQPSDLPANKRVKTETTNDAQSAPTTPQSVAEEKGIVQRKYYPAEMSNARCAQYNKNQIPRPLEVLEKAIRETAGPRKVIQPGQAVLHWFKRDLRINDNRPLSMAAAKAKSAGIPLIALYIISPQDYEAHVTSAARIDFDLRTLALMKTELEAMNIPLLVTTVDKRKELPNFLLEHCQKYEIKHVYCGIEYEVDELRRETKVIKSCLANGIDFTPVHDDVVVPPGAIKTGAGTQYAVYTPWFRSWIAYIHKHPDILNAPEKPGANPASARETLADLFESTIPTAPENKQLPPDMKTQLERVWPPGEHEALARLKKFLTAKVKAYKDKRNFPAVDATAKVSVHHAAGTLAARTSIRLAREANSSEKLDAGNPGVMCWISEVAWRDFYKHVLAHWPYVCMNKPFKFEYSDIEWEYNDEHFQRWCEGKTGYPIVDAAMRQIRATAYCHNRLRMVVASFLAKDLLLDWRLGERYFMASLIDGDFASNSGGWGFSASVGVDPQPYFRIFNPLLQSEKFDPDGDFIRKWVPELRLVKGKAIHDPYARGEGKAVKKLGYPEPIVEHKFARARALERYKRGIGKETA